MPKDSNLKLKYECVDSEKINDILNRFKNHESLEYIKELWALIDYQKIVIKEERKQLIAAKHSREWQHYDKDENTYNSNTKNYLDRPDKTDTMGR